MSTKNVMFNFIVLFLPCIISSPPSTCSTPFITLFFVVELEDHAILVNLNTRKMLFKSLTLFVITYLSHAELRTSYWPPMFLMYNCRPPCRILLQDMCCGQAHNTNWTNATHNFFSSEFCSILLQKVIIPLFQKPHKAWVWRAHQDFPVSIPEQDVLADSSQIYPKTESPRARERTPQRDGTE